jgi:hypothetical protein
MIVFLRWLRVILAATGLACVAILCGSLVYLLFALVTSRDNISSVLQAAHMPQIAELFASPGDTPPDPPDPQRQYMYADFISVTGWAIDCMKLGSISEVPSNIVRIFQPTDYVRGEDPFALVADAPPTHAAPLPKNDKTSSEQTPQSEQATEPSSGQKAEPADANVAYDFSRNRGSSSTRNGESSN